MFSRFLQQHASGRTDEMLATALETLILAVEQFEGPGRMLVTIEVRPAARGKVNISCDVEVRPPWA